MTADNRKSSGTQDLPFTLSWIEAEFDFPRGRKLPAWQRQAALGSDGEVYMPAVVAASEMEVMLCAGYDGVGLVFGLDNKHLYAPSGWLRREFPGCSDACDAVERAVREALS